MKGNIGFFSSMMLGMSVIAGCNKVELNELQRIRGGSETVIDSLDSRYYVPDTYRHDTTLRFVTVEAEDGYDWRRDTLAGAFRGTLTMYRNMEPELVLEVSPENEISPDYGTHFIIGGKLFTWFCTESVSVLKCNGAEMMRVPGRENLKGILPTADGVLTLSEKPEGGEFIVRRDGSDVMNFRADAVYGSMEDDAYPLSGALYMDGDKHYFCYRATVAGGTAYYIVENLNARVLTPPMDLSLYDIKDIRMDRGSIDYFTIYKKQHPCLFRRGKEEHLSGSSGLEVYFDGRILPNRAMSTCYGNFTKPGSPTGRSLFFYPIINNVFSHFHDGFFIPGTGGAHSLLKYTDKDYLVAFFRGNGGPRAGHGCYCFSRRSTSCINNCIYIAFTPRSDGLKPYIWKSEGDTVQVNVKNGYLTSMVVVDTVTTIPGGFRPDLVK